MWLDGGGDGSSTMCVSLCADTPLSGHGHRVSEAFEGAAAELRGSEVKPAVVDAAKEKDLAKELNVTGLSEIRLYLAGDKHSPVVCPGMCKKQIETIHSILKSTLPPLLWLELYLYYQDAALVLN